MNIRKDIFRFSLTKQNRFINLRYTSPIALALIGPTTPHLWPSREQLSNADVGGWRLQRLYKADTPLAHFTAESFPPTDESVGITLIILS